MSIIRVEFIDKNGSGPGVRLRKRFQKKLIACTVTDSAAKIM
jgi:hypothetical protein